MSRIPEAKTAAGAIVMALGIFSQGVLAHFTGSGTIWDRIWAILVAAVWLYLCISYTTALKRGTFASKHVSSTIGRLAIGTWVAGTSTLVVVETKAFDGFRHIAWVLLLFNAALWLFYLFCMVRSARELAEGQRYAKIHGVVLLAAVSTQSIVLMLAAVFPKDEKMVNIVSEALLMFGILFYLAAAVLLAYRYISRRWNLSEDWNNTNCMLHGAASITGAAAWQTHALPSAAVIGIWFYALLMFLLVEAVEIARAAARVRRYGLRKGVWIYDVSQWARLFTFGMFYFFTSKLRPALETMHPSWPRHMDRWILTYGAWLVLVMLLTEIALSFADRGGSRETAL